MDIEIRPAAPGDAQSLLAVYAPYVEGTAITFEYEVPSVEEFRGRIERTLARYPYIAAEQAGHIVGYAYAGPFHTRAAYAWAVETSIYVDRGKRHQGIGGRLHGALEAVLKAQGFLNMNACIATPREEDEYLTLGSVRFHERLGYRMVGEFTQVGYKFGRWYNMAWMEKTIGPHGGEVRAPLPFEEAWEQVHRMFTGGKV